MAVPIGTEIQLATGPLFVAADAAGAEAVAVLVRPGGDGPVLCAGAAEVASRIDPAAALAHEHARGEPGEVVDMPVITGQGAARVLFAGIGGGEVAAMRRAGAALARRLRGRTAVAVAFADAARESAKPGAPSPGTGGGFGAEQLAAFAEGLLLASYTFTLSPRGGARPPVERAALVVGDTTPYREGLARAVVTARAVALARDLTNTPSAEKTPEWLAERAVAAAADAGLTARIAREDDLRADGFGGILAVGMGSARPPRLIELSYPGMPAAGGRPHVVLVGKGITFDSGGLSLKPNDNMKLMKTDMAGGAAVIAAMTALRDLGVRARVTGLVPAAENMLSGSAQRPGDVITHYGGRTVEVLNTDAEGRLVLADALAYADRVLHPDVVVDLATLTGAVRVALGSTHAGLYANDDGLAARLQAAGDASGDRVWRLPLAADYRDGLDSDVADLANIARKDYGAGSVVAALFLEEFTGGRPWAHLDIAGAARSASDDHEISKGGTGFGVRLLLRWLVEHV